MKKFTILFLLLMIIGIATADVYTIGTGTSTQSYIPFYGLWDYGWSKVIYTATELSTAGLSAGQIDGIGFEVGNTPSSYVSVDQRVYVRHTTAAQYESTDNTLPDNSAFQNVYYADYTWNGGGWHYIMFSSPFIWDGTSNLEIVWENWDGDYASGPTFRYTTTTPSYQAVYKYADDNFPATLTGTRVYNRPNLAIVTPSVNPPNPAVAIYPTNAGWAFLDGVLSWADGGGMPAGYDVYLDTVDGTTLVSDDQPGTTYTPTLAAGTTYYWKVVPYNANGSATGVSTWSFKTPSATQIAESFDDTTFPPLGWTTPDGAFTRSTSTPFYGTASAYEYIAAGPSYLHTSMLELTASSELDWWMRTTTTTGIGRVQVVYSSDASTWNNIGDEISLPTETTWMNYNVDLSSLASNNYYIGFKVYSSTSSSSSFYIDHVVGPELAALTPEPVALVYPADAGWTFLDGSLSWTPATTGGIPTSYDVYFGTSSTPPNVTNQAELTYTPALAANTTYYWQIVPRNDTGSADDCPTWSFKTPTAEQIAESFDDTTFPPLGWTTPDGAFTRSTSTPFYGAASAYEYISTGPSYLHTSMLELTASSELDWWMRTTTTTGIGRVQVVYSSDASTWNNIGDEISLPTETTWMNYNVDLSSLAGNNYFIGFKVYSSTSSSSSFYIDHVFGPELAAIVPDAVTLTTPADLDTDVSTLPTFSWTPGTAGGIPTGFKVYCDTNVNPTTEIADVTAPTYTATTALNYSTTYYWKVVAYNGTGDSADSAIRSFTTMADPIIYTMPWLENFGTTGDPFPPANWTRYNGLLEDPSTLTTTTSGWLQDDFANVVTDPTNESARLNIFGTTYKYWLMSPPIQMPGAGYQLEFDIALTKYNNAEAPIDPAGYSGVDDKFVVLISDGSTWSTANAVKVWDNDVATTGGIYEVYNDVPHTGSHWVLPLDDYTGIKHIAFYGESTVSNADNDFFVDNVRIRLGGQAPQHVTLLSPEDNSSSVDPSNCILNWQNAIGGGAPSYYEVHVSSSLIDPINDEYGDYFYETSNSTLDLSAQLGIDLGFSTIWYWAVLPRNDDGNPDPLDGLQVFRFTTLPDPTIVTLPQEEYFDSVTAPALPYGWTSVVDATSTSAYVNTYSSTTYAVSAPNSARMYNYNDTAANLMLITPEIDVAINTIKAKFYARGSTAGQVLLVGTVNLADSTFTEIGSIATTTTQTQYEVSFDSYTGADTHIAFQHGLGSTYRTIYLDNVQLIELLANDLAATAVSNPGIMTAGTAYEFTVDVYNEGTATQNAYTVKLMSVDSRTELASLAVSTPLDSGASAQHILSWTPATGGVQVVYGKVVLTGDQYAGNDDSGTTELYILDSSMTVLSVGDDETTSSGYYLPIGMFHKNSVSEELYFSDELHLQTGTITAIVYKNTFASDLADKAMKIWMAHTAATDLTGGWLPSVDYTLVFDGTVDFPSGINYIIIPLDTPYAFTGGTLATRVNRPMDTAYYSSSDKFYYTTTAAHTNRSRYLNSDSVTYDPMAPSAAGTAVGYVPNTMFVVQNAVMQTGAIIEGYVRDASTNPIEGATVSLTERAVTTTDATGFYQFTFWADTAVDLTVAKATYYSQTVSNIALTMGNTVTQNFTLVAMPRVTVNGIVTANDFPTGLEGAEISLFGAENYSVLSGTGGAFSIPNVLGSNATLTYTIEVSKEGYQSYSSTFDVIESPVNLGTINLTENLWTAYNLVATHSGENAQLVWEPAAEPDYYFSDFENDNGGWVGSGYGDWEWTDSYNSGNYVAGEYATSEVPPVNAYSGTGLWGTLLYAPYSMSGAWSYLTQSFDLAAFDSPQLSFWRWNNLYYTFDYYYVEVSTDGSAWTTVHTETAIDNNWTQKIVDLSAYSDQIVQIRFAMYATSVVSYGGLYIDDVYVGPATGRRNVSQTLGSKNGDRSFESYDLHRFLADDAGNPANWTTLASTYADTTYTDYGFDSLSGGKYQWAVTANYSGSLASPALFSNSLGRVYDPADIAATTVGTSVVLSWTAEPGANYYKVYESEDPYGTFSYLGYSATATYTVASPAAKKFYKVSAVADEAVPSPAPPAKNSK